MALLLGVVLGPACEKNRAASTVPPKVPTLRIYAVSSTAGALEPCGCRKDMLGGIDHAAAFLRARAADAPNAVFVAAGPTFFVDPTLPGDRKVQAGYKADALARALGDLGLVAWAPGANDWALGAEKLAKLRDATGARLLAANLDGVRGARATVVLERGSYKIGIVGVSVPRHDGRLPPGVEARDAAASLAHARDTLAGKGARIRVALVSLDRGEALRLAERVRGFHVLIVGKPYDAGESNDAPTPPVLVDRTLVIQPPNHLQAVAVVDLFVRGDDFVFHDGSGLKTIERREDLKRRISELEARLDAWSKQNGAVAKADVEARRKDLAALRSELAKLPQSAPDVSGSFFRYTLTTVRESLGTEPTVAARMQDYYKKVNRHNRVAFEDRMPAPVEKGRSSYVGVEECADCHEEAVAFWKETGHAKAYETLQKEYKEFNLDCVGCHVTGYEKPGGSTVTHVATLQDVQCEACHGPGSKHAETEAARDIRREPRRELCRDSCHQPPHVASDWSVDEQWRHILGPGHGQKLDGGPLDDQKKKKKK